MECSPIKNIEISECINYTTNLKYIGIPDIKTNKSLLKFLSLNQVELNYQEDLKAYICEKNIFHYYAEKFEQQ